MLHLLDKTTMKNIITLLVTIIGFSVSAQDIHFTMFHASPIVMNPASAGVFEGTFRASTNYKSQWGSVANPYSTYSLTADGSFWKNKMGNAHMGAGVNFYKDVAGATNFGTTKINVSLSSILSVSDLSVISIGLTGGWGQRTISPDALQWDSQFNGVVFDNALPTNESMSFQNDKYFDFAAGVVWSYGSAASTLASFNRFKAKIGAAYHHLSRPEINNYNTPEKMYSKYALHADMQYADQYSKLSYKPRIGVYVQGPSLEINAGLMFRYLIKEGSKYTGNVKGLALSLGGYYRVADALSPSIELEVAGFTIGYSYDLNTSGLRVASKGRGGSEFYLKFQNPNPFFRFSRKPSIL